MRNYILLVAIVVSLGFVGAVIAFRQRAEPPDKLREFCVGVRQAMHEDVRALRSGDVARQEDARHKLLDSQIIYHGSQSVLMCVAKLPPIPSACVANADYECLAAIANGIEDAISEGK